MKTNLFTLTLLLMSAGAFAQTAFNRPTFDALMNRYEKDPVKFLKTETAPGFLFVGSDIQDVTGTIAIYDRLQQLSRTYELVAVRQYGSTGIATGLINHSYTRKNTGQPYSIKELFTYVFTNETGKAWKLVSVQHRPYSPSIAADEAAVKQAIEGLTTSMYARDFKTYLNYWVNAPYVSRVSTDREGKVTKMTGDEYRKMVEQYATQNLKPSGEKATRDNWLIRVNGNSAFVVFDQHNQYPDGTNRDSVEERYLERVNNEWKLVNVTVLVAK